MIWPVNKNWRNIWICRSWISSTRTKTRIYIRTTCSPSITNWPITTNTTTSTTSKHTSTIISSITKTTSFTTRSNTTRDSHWRFSTISRWIYTPISTITNPSISKNRTSFNSITTATASNYYCCCIWYIYWWCCGCCWWN